ncbi:olfactory receptor 1496-like [Gastrophryne carolinensis]
MGNQTVITELYLSGLSDLPSLQLPLFLVFLLIYLLTITWNLLIISLIVIDPRLHTTMYFFLGNLASLDLCSSSVTIPRMLFDLNTRKNVISTGACIAQIYFFIAFGTSELFLLSFMSYDRYVAICHPLHYMQMMPWKLCLRLMATAWFLGSCYSLVFALYALKLTFCASNIIESFVCDLSELLKIACSGVSENSLLILILGSIVSVGTLLMTFFPYVPILKTVLKMPVNKSKVFSTCSSHLTVVFLYYSSIIFNYLCPKPKDSYSFDKLASVIYTVLMPLLNPVIYSLRNQEFGRAFRDVLIRKISITKPCKLPFAS